MPGETEIRPASTVVLLRDSSEGIETLLLKRNKALNFAGGFWVFPGGRVDPGDLDAAAGDEELAARIAAAREAQEECGLSPATDDMVQLSHWTTPAAESRRFATWFYAAPVRDRSEVVIDGGEIHDHRWLSATSALAEHRAGRLAILPPTFATLCTVASYPDVASLVRCERDSACPWVLPVLVPREGGFVALYEGDAGYSCADPDACGPRHRASFDHGYWEYTYHGVAPEFPPLIPQP